jgi:general secretion pathway protein J
MSVTPNARGFTLIELLAAITLLGLLAAILMGTVRGAERSTTAATDVVERTEQYARTQAFLRDHIGGALPLRWRREVNQPLKFSGKQNTLTYFAPVTSQIAEGGVMWWQLAVAKPSNANKGSQLVLRRLPVVPDEKAVPDLASADAIVLADNIDALTIAYFDPGDDPLTNPDGGTWLDSWDENARMPTLITLRVTEAGNRKWPDLTVPLKLSQALGCNFDFQRQRCIIQGAATR